MSMKQVTFWRKAGAILLLLGVLSTITLVQYSRFLNHTAANQLWQNITGLLDRQTHYYHTHGQYAYQENALNILHLPATQYWLAPQVQTRYDTGNIPFLIISVRGKGAFLGLTLYFHFTEGVISHVSCRGNEQKCLAFLKSFCKNYRCDDTFQL